jgi:glycosyltransferase involved in cell wall biosynthesis
MLRTPWRPDEDVVKIETYPATLNTPDTWTAPASQRVRRRRPMRVCYLIDDLGTGGTEGQLLSLIQHVDRAAVEPSLCLLRGLGRRSRSFEPDNCPVIRLGVGALRSPKTLSKFVGFVRWLRQQRCDILHLYFQDSTIFGVPAGRLARVPQILCTRVNLAQAETSLQRWLVRGCTRWADRVIANSLMCRQAALELDGARANAVEVIENGVALARFEDIPPVEWTAGWRPQRIGLLANLRPVKDPGTLLVAARAVVARHPETSFFLAGEGELRPALQDMIRRLRLQEHVFLMGDVQDVPGFLSTIDIGVLCSLSEGAPNAVLEYMAAGRAIVATEVGGTVQVVRDGVTGLLVPPADPSKLAKALLRLIENPDEAARLAQTARDYVYRHHDAALRARRFETLYAAWLG